MGNLEEIADRIEFILRKVMSEASSIDPAPVNYFMIQNQCVHGHWILGFLFKNMEDLRTALLNGVCYQIHDYVYKSICDSEELKGLKRYIVFDCGDLPESDSDYQKLHDKCIKQLDALEQERGKSNLELCGICGHDFDEHKMLGQIVEGDSYAKEGWMVCPDEKCTCFRTWSLGDES